ncbi:MAG TPA: dTDP-4-dehydrorhamnose 3,5-epimerase [Hyphomicrobium sp.]|nr:dTDP-4-dehydrorhamnose 3,5-epimerase [Hyphomicrobium sp.]
MQITNLGIPDILLMRSKRFYDNRGFFAELYNSEKLARVGIRETFVQDNFSRSSKVGTIRGLHFQLPPHGQAKLVRVSRGRIFDVAVDLRRESSTYGRHVAAELSAEDGLQLYIPDGFAHGFCTLEPETEVVYKVSSYYAPHAEKGILWSDPQLKIDWPVSPEDATISDKDTALPLLRDLSSMF